MPKTTAAWGNPSRPVMPSPSMAEAAVNATKTAASTVKSKITAGLSASEGATEAGLFAKWAKNELPGLANSMSKLGTSRAAAILGKVGKVGGGLLLLGMTYQLADDYVLRPIFGKLFGESKDEAAKLEAARAAKVAPVTDQYLTDEQARTDEEKRLRRKVEAETDIAGYGGTFARQSAVERQATQQTNAVSQRSIAGTSKNNSAMEELAYQLAKGGQIDPALLGGISV